MKRTDIPFFTPDQIALIKNDLLKGAPEFEIERFLIVCERTGLDPFSRQIYGYLQSKKVKKQGSRDQYEYVKTVAIITSIDGFRAIGERSGQYRGQTPPEWYYLNHEGESDWHDVFITPRDRAGNPLKVPDACRVGVIREGFPDPCYGVANFESFAKYYKEGADQGNGWVLDTFWKKMPEHMIAKVAEAQAFRKAFPLLACGLFVEEEVKAEEEEQSAPGHEVAGAAVISLPPATTAPAATPASIPEAPLTPAPTETPAGGPPATPKPVKKQRGRRAAPETEPPATPAEPFTPPATPAPAANAGGWQGHVISQIAMAEYQGKKLGELTAVQIEFLKTKWVDKYAAKIAMNPAKQAEADLITEAFHHHFPA